MAENVSKYVYRFLLGFLSDRKQQFSKFLAELHTLVDIPSSISFVMCSLSKNFISIGAKLEVCQGLSSSECNLHLSLNGGCVFYITIILLMVVSKAKYISKPNCLRYLLYLFSYFYIKSSQKLLFAVFIIAKHLNTRAQFLLNLCVFPQNSTIKCFAKRVQLLVSMLKYEVQVFLQSTTIQMKKYLQFEKIL